MGYIDVLSFGSQKATVTHSLHIKEAGDINSMVVGKEAGEVLVSCEKGLLVATVTAEGAFSITKAVSEYSNLTIVSVSWATDSKYVIVTSRRRYKSKKEIPTGSVNYQIVSYTVFDTAITDSEASNP